MDFIRKMSAPSSKPAKKAPSAADASLAAAEAKLDEARSLEASRRYTAALAAYDNGLELLLACLKRETDAGRKARLGHRAAADMGRAEALKKRLRATKRGPDHHNYAAPIPRKAPVRAAPPAPAAAAAAAPPAAAAAASAMEQIIVDEMLDASPGVRWDDIAGLAVAKRTLREAVVLPYARPDLFKGLRSPPKGVLLFGPPGTGKTLLARAVASESAFAFFAVSAAALTSKWVGDGEKMVRALFSAARARAPAAVFLDEVDSCVESQPIQDTFNLIVPERIFGGSLSLSLVVENSGSEYERSKNRRKRVRFDGGRDF